MNLFHYVMPCSGYHVHQCFCILLSQVNCHVQFWWQSIKLSALSFTESSGIINRPSITLTDLKCNIYISVIPAAVCVCLWWSINTCSHQSTTNWIVYSIHKSHAHKYLHKDINRIILINNYSSAWLIPFILWFIHDGKVVQFSQFLWHLITSENTADWHMTHFFLSWFANN